MALYCAINAAVCNASTYSTKFNSTPIWVRDVSQTNLQLRSWADSTVVIVQNGDVTPDLSGTRAALTTSPLGPQLNLCPKQRFYDQPAGLQNNKQGFWCSGFLIAPNLVATAGHCVNTIDDCKKKKIIFGFSYQKQDSTPSTITMEDVYSCTNIISRNENKTDYALLQLDRPVPPARHQPLKVDPAGTPQPCDQLVLIGHPTSLPTKIVTGARVSYIGQNTFHFNYGAYAGFSGSPVLNTTTGLVEGIAVAGDGTYMPSGRSGSCKMLVDCPGGSCSGTTATSISALFPALKQPAPQISGNPLVLQSGSKFVCSSN